jgi:hypothetical protein
MNTQAWCPKKVCMLIERFAERVCIRVCVALDFCAPPLSTRMSWNHPDFRHSHDEMLRYNITFPRSRLLLTMNIQAWCPKTVCMLGERVAEHAAQMF